MVAGSLVGEACWENRSPEGSLIFRIPPLHTVLNQLHYAGVILSWIESLRGTSFPIGASWLAYLHAKLVVLYSAQLLNKRELSVLRSR